MNRCRQALATLGMVFFCISAFAQYDPIHARYYFTSPNTAPQGLRLIRLTPQFEYTANGTNIASGDYLEQRATAGGSATFSNLVPGQYEVRLFGTTKQTVITNSFGTNVSGLVNGVDYIGISTNLPDGGFAYSIAAANAHFAPIAATNWVTYTVGISNAMFRNIQSALNAAVPDPATNGFPKGYLIQIGPGVFNSNGPPLRLTNRFVTSIILQGSGEISTVIHGASNVLTTTGNLGDPEGARLHLYVRDLALICDQNTTNPIVRFDEAAVRDFEHVYFSYNGYITNTQWGISTAPSLPNPLTYPMLAYGVHLANTDENGTWFRNCHFEGLADGIYGGCAHLFVVGCQFQHVGKYNGGSTNGWPKTDARAVGGGVVMDGMSYEGHIEKCAFVHCRSAGALLNSLSGIFRIRDNYDEVSPSWYNDDTGGWLQMFGVHTDPQVKKLTASDYTATGNALSTTTYFEGLLSDNLEGASPPFWSLYFAAVNRLQILTNYTLFYQGGNLAVNATNQFTGNGYGVTNQWQSTTNIRLNQSSVTIPHGFTNITPVFNVVLVCLTNDSNSGYLAGDELEARTVVKSDDGFLTLEALPVIWASANTNSITVGFRQAIETFGTTYGIMPKTGSDPSDAPNWARFRAKVYYRRP